MILSEANKFVFVKGHKVASTSVEVYLSQFCGAEDIVTPLTPIDERGRLQKGWAAAQNYGLDKVANDAYLNNLLGCSPDELAATQVPRGNYYNHMPLVEILKVYGDIPEDWMIFSVERCPYRKVISLANMMLKFNEYKRSGADMLTTLDALKEQIRVIVATGEVALVKNIDLYKTPAGSKKVTILRFEHLEEQLKKVVETFDGIEKEPVEHYKKGASSQSLDIRAVFDDYQIQLINNIYREEFECFGYEMLS